MHISIPPHPTPFNVLLYGHCSNCSSSLMWLPGNSLTDANTIRLLCEFLKNEECVSLSPRRYKNVTFPPLIFPPLRQNPSKSRSHMYTRLSNHTYHCNYPKVSSHIIFKIYFLEWREHNNSESKRELGTPASWPQPRVPSFPLKSRLHVSLPDLSRCLYFISAGMQAARPKPSGSAETKQETVWNVLVLGA